MTTEPRTEGNPSAGTAQPPDAAWAAFWRRLAELFEGRPKGPYEAT
jgi:hypothetical protein